MDLYKKIVTAKVKFPNWFAPRARRLLKRILDPNPNTRISIEKIMQSSWFQKDLRDKETESVDEYIEVEAEANASEENDKKRCINLNAFEIISLSTGFDLSGLFEKGEEKEEMRFTSNKEASEIIAKLVEIGKELKMKVRTKEQGWRVKIAGEAAVVEGEVFEIAPSFHMVMLKKSGVDTTEYK